MDVRSPGVMVTLAAAALLTKGLSNQGACLGLEAAACQAIPPRFCTEAAGGVLLKKVQSVPSGGIWQQLGAVCCLVSSVKPTWAGPDG